MPYSAPRLQSLILALLRVAIGWHFTYEGLSKLLTKNWSAAGYLEVSRWAFSGLFHSIAALPAALKAVNILVPWALLFIGIGLMLGLFTRTAAAGGMLMLAFFWIANPPITGLGLSIPTEGSYVIVDKNLVELFALAVIVAFRGGMAFGLDSLFGARLAMLPAVPEASNQDRRAWAASFAGVPFFAAFAMAAIRKEQWRSYEVRNLLEAEAAPSSKALQIASLTDLKGRLPVGEIRGLPFSRIILGGNLLSGYAHSRDLIYVSSLVKAYHTKERIFSTLLTAEKCGVNTLLTNPIMATLVSEYWKRNIGKIQFISDCAGMDYSVRPSRLLSFDEYVTRIQRAIDYGACACYIQGETADRFIREGKIEYIHKAIEVIRRNKVLAGIGGHELETIRACVEGGLKPDFWMKTLHHHNYWSAKHTEEHDNVFCKQPEETIAYMKTVREPWIAFKTLAAGAIRPQDGLSYAFRNGADFVCLGMYDFQMVADVNIAMGVLKSDLGRQRPWADGRAT